MRTVYLDLLFCLNGYLDMIVLLGCGICLGYRAKKIRLISASIFGGVCACVCYLWGSRFSWIIAITGGIVMVAICYGFRSVQSAILLIAAEFLASFALGGILSLSARFFGVHSEIRAGVFYAEIPICVTVFTSAAIYYIARKVLNLTGRKKGDALMSKVLLRNGEKTVKLIAFTDTGNTLTDPLSGEPVMIVDFAVAKKLFSGDIARTLRVFGVKNPVATFSKLCELEGSSVFRLIPFNTVGETCSLLLAFRCEFVECDGVEKKNVLIAISSTVLSSTGKFSALTGV